MKTIRRAVHLRRSALATALLIALGAADSTTFAATLPVSNCTDHDSGSLRAVIASAHEGDTVDMSALTCSSITLASEIAVNRNALTIQGPAGIFSTGSINISGAQNFRVFDHKGTGVLELDNLALTDGKYANSVAKGGCVYSAGSVTLNNSSVTGCKVNATAGKAGGAGIYALNTVTLNHSSVSGNVAESDVSNGAYGGGIRANTLVVDYGTIHDNKAAPGAGAMQTSSFRDFGGGVFLYQGTGSSISNSTVDGNYAYGSGGGLYVVGGTLTITNSTVSGNVAGNGDGGISAINVSAPTTLNVSNSTVAFNHDMGTIGFGIAIDGGSLVLQSSIVANNTEGNFNLDDLDCFKCTLSGAKNLVQSFYSGDDVLPPAGLITITSDPQLAPLGDRGGSTRTHALLAGSSAIETGENPKHLTYDQRGVGFNRDTTRGVPHTDIGAYQRQPTEDELFYDGLEGTRPLGQPWINTLIGGLNDPQGIAIDGSGNLFFSNTGEKTVREAFVADGYQSSVTLGSGFAAPQGIAIDSSGNVFVADEANNEVKEIVAAGGYVTVNILGSGFNLPFAVAVDAGGNVFVADSGHNAVKEIVAVNGSIPATPTIKTLGSGFNFPSGVAVDGKGDVFVAGFGDSTVKEIIAVNGSIPANPTINTLGSGFSSPTAVALDSSGNVYVADVEFATIEEILAAGGYKTVTALGNGFNVPDGVAVDAKGNVIVADTDNNVIKEIIGR